MKNVTTFKVRTSAPRGRSTWNADTGAKIQANLFAMVAMIVAENPDAETKLMKMITDAKTGTGAFPVAV